MWTSGLLNNPASRFPDSMRRLLFLDPATEKAAMHDSAWADGLRGIASLYVVASHIVLCFARGLVFPCCARDSEAPMLFQRPVFRLIAAGHSWVGIFFVLTGFVNALKPLKLARGGQVEASLTNLAVSAFRRTFRLVLPAAAATTMSWFICQLGFYNMARNSDAYWLYSYTPEPSPSWGTAIDDLFRALRATWTLDELNVYDQPQWALIHLFQASMMIFTILLMTINLTSGWRAAVVGVFALWSFDWSLKCRDPLVGFTVFGGVLLSEFSMTSYPVVLSGLSPFLGPVLALFGLVLMSFPSDGGDRAPWSAAILGVAQRIFPAQGEWWRTIGSTGAMVLVLAILASPHLRRLLSTPPLRWLGKVSFPIYLLHGTFMRTLMTWLVFAGQPWKNEEVKGEDDEVYNIARYEQPGNLRIVLSIAVSMAAMLLASHFWTMRLEPLFGRITKAAEDLMVGKREGAADGGQRMGNGRSVLPVRK